MRRLLLGAAAVILVAATPQEALPGLEANGYFIEEGAGATEQVVSNAVFEGRAAGGRLYIVVLAEEPPGGATTFSDSTLDLLGVDGYVVTVAPESVGYAGEGGFWTKREMDAAVDASLEGGSDDEVVRLFIETLVGEEPPPDEGGGQPEPVSPGGGLPLGWIFGIGLIAFGIWWMVSSRKEAKRRTRRLAEVKALAREKLAQVANDILGMEDEVAVTDNTEVKEHYQRASSMYSRAIEDTERAVTVPEMLEVTGELDLAIWELDCAEALLDGKPRPPKPEPPQTKVVMPPTREEGGTTVVPPPYEYDRRPERQSDSSSDVLSMLLTMMAMGRLRGPGGWGGFGGPGGWTGGGGGGRIRGGGGRIRGGGRRR